MTTTQPFALVTLKAEAKRATVRRFATWDEANAAGEATTPDTDGALIPNLPQSLIDQWDRKAPYSSGLFWHGNRYAAIFNEGGSR